MSRSKVKVTGTKKTTKCSILFWGGVPVRHFFGSGPLGAVLYAGGKISACRLVVFASVATDCTTVFLYFSKQSVSARRTTARTTVAVV